MSTAPEKTKKQLKDEVGLSQSRLILRRFFRHKMAVASLVVVFLITLLAFTSIGFGPIPGWWPLKSCLGVDRLAVRCPVC